MKILHTADWHLGHRLHEQSGSPSNQSLEMYYDFLIKLKSTTCQSVIITGGNHDSPGTLNAPKHLLNALAIKVVGRATKDIKDEIFKLEINGEKVIIAAIPYLRDGDIRRALAGESYTDLTEKYKTALINHYQAAAEHCKLINTNDAPVIAMGHLFAREGSVSDSEQNIYVGSLGHIGAEDFPEYFDYIALGHLHGPQIIAGNAKISYSGSPYILSFNEIDYEKKVVVVTIENNQINDIKFDFVPRFREFYSLTGKLKQCINEFPNVISNTYELIPWVEIILDEKNTINTDELKKTAEKYSFAILKTSLLNQRKVKGIEELLNDTKSIKELVPTEVFKLKCKEMDYDLKENPEILDAFNEILQLVKNQ